MLHFICGSTGAGKSTYAAELAAEIDGMVFNIDEWMAKLYWQNAPHPLLWSWMADRVRRWQAMIWETAKQVAMRGVPCVLEIGFNQAKTRSQFAAFAKDAGPPVRLYLLDESAEERWRRVEKRNADKSGPLGADVTREMFDFVEALWERLVRLRSPPSMNSL